MTETDLERLLEGVAPGLLVFHFDLTDCGRILPRRQSLCLSLESKGWTLLNGRFTTMSKRSLHAACDADGIASARATQDGDPAELLIVKTDRNSGGHAEHNTPFGADLRELGIEPQPVVSSADHGYRVLPRQEITSATWHDPGLVVERYVSNRAGRFHRIYVLGDRYAISSAYSTETIKTIGRSSNRHDFLAVRRRIDETSFSACPPWNAEACRAVFTLLDRMHLQYGAIDVAEDDAGALYVLDVNATPHWGEEKGPSVIPHLRGAFDVERERRATLTRARAGRRAIIAPMTVERCRRLLATTIPRLVIDTIRKIGEGHSRSVFAVNDRYVFKFPSHRYSDSHLMREAWFCQRFSGVRDVRVPELVYLVPPSEEFPATFVGLTFVPGLALPWGYRDLTHTARARVADALASFLHAVHGTTVSLQGQRLIKTHFSGSPEWQEVARRGLARSGLGARQRAAVSSYLRSPEKAWSTNTSALIHGDLWPDHVLVDPQRPHPPGVIDFGSAGLGDPDFDMTYVMEVDPSVFVPAFGLSGSPQRLAKLEYYKAMTMLETLGAEKTRVHPEDTAMAARWIRTWADGLRPEARTQ